MVTKAQIRAKDKYNKKVYDSMSIRVKKGGNAYIVSLATKAGKSKAQFIKDLVLAEAEKYGAEEREKARTALLTDTAISGGGSEPASEGLIGPPIRYTVDSLPLQLARLKLKEAKKTAT